MYEELFSEIKEKIEKEEKEIQTQTNRRNSCFVVDATFLRSDIRSTFFNYFVSLSDHFIFKIFFFEAPENSEFFFFFYYFFYYFF